jgi:magnesium transporter
MIRFFKRGTGKAGLPPGTLIHTGETPGEAVTLSWARYNDKELETDSATELSEALLSRPPGKILWINMDGIHRVEMIERIGKSFGIHPLTLEDVVNTGQRPKLESYDTYIFIVLKMLYLDESLDEVRAEQVSLVLGDGFLLSFQETPLDVFDAVRDRLKRGTGRIRQAGADYLAYALMDAMVDHYFLVLEIFAERMESLEDELLGDPGRDAMGRIHEMKREMIFLRRQVWPLKGILGRMKKTGPPLVKKTTGVYLNDVLDHTAQVVETVSSFRDILTGMLDLYLSTVSNRMNEVMKVLTIISTLFIPLTFLAGIYGMNFEYMPELEWRWGYVVLLGIMAVIVVAMLIFFKRKRWL